MNSPLLALFIRSLREDSRSKFTYFARAGLILTTLLFLFMIQSSMGWANAPGLRFFQTVVMIDFVFVILAGVSYFSSAISEEKEEMTLGLLRMTNLNPLSILLGKSTSRLCTATLLFAAQIPFTMLAVTLGGISMRQIIAAYAALGAFLVLVSNLALLASVVARRTGLAAVLTGGSLALVFLIFPLASSIVLWPVKIGLIKVTSGWVTACQAIATFIHDASPTTRFEVIFRTGFQEGAMCFQVATNLIAGVVLFLLAWALFDVFCSEQKEVAPTRMGASRRRGLRQVFGASRTWRWALAWKEFYFTTGGKFLILLKFVIYGVPLVIIRFWPQDLGGPPRFTAFGYGLIWFMVIFFTLELAFGAGSIFRVERQGQTLSSLAMLPQGIRRVAYQKVPGLIPSLLPVLSYLCWGLFLIRKDFPRTMDFRWDRQSDWMALMGFALVVWQGIFFLHLVANLSLRVKRGAFPLAFGIHFLLIMFSGFFMALMFRGDSPLVTLLLITIVATAFLHFNIGHRLEQLSAED